MATLEKESEGKDKYAKKVLKQAESLFDILTGRKAVQLSLFKTGRRNPPTKSKDMIQANQ